MKFRVNEGAPVVRFIQAVKSDNIPIRINAAAPVRWIKGAAFRAKIVHIKIVALAALVALYPPHIAPPFLFYYHHSTRLEFWKDFYLQTVLKSAYFYYK